MNDTFHNPYHFVPLPRARNGGAPDLPGRRDAKPHLERRACLDAGHSRFAKARHSGRITCTLTTVTPTFIGARRFQEASENQPARIAPCELGGQPAIPATSLRGMISAIAEAASGSAMRVLDAGRPLSHRMATGQAHQRFGMLIQNQSGALYLRDLTDQKKTKYQSHWTITMDGQEKKLADFARTADLEKFYFRDPHDKDTYFSSDGEGRIRGKFRVMDAKRRKFPKSPDHRDFFIEIPAKKITRNDCLEIPAPILDEFHAMADEIAERSNKPETPEDLRLPYHPLGTRRNLDPRKYGDRIRLKPGDLVHFSLDENRRVTGLALSAIWRAGKGRLRDYIEDRELLPFHPARKRLTPAERVFGFVGELPENEENRPGVAPAYAGHVRFSAARWDGRLPEGADGPYLDEVTLKILDSPKPPSPALYFRTKKGSNTYIAKQALDPEKHLPQGRKFYLHKKAIRDDDDPWRTRNNQRMKQKSRITPLRRELTFTFQVDFDNLDDFELGMLLYALVPGDRFHHKLGMGKPLGLGSVRTGIDTLELSDRLCRYQTEGPFPAPDASGASRRIVDEQSWKTIRDEAFKKKISDICPQIIGALEALGDPGKVTAPVRYPQVASIDGHPLDERQQEQENYRWWVANDRSSCRQPPPKEQCLQPVNAAATLPTLRKHKFKKT